MHTVKYTKYACRNLDQYDLVREFLCIAADADVIMLVGANST